jgi:hypothetical protein
MPLLQAGYRQLSNIKIERLSKMLSELKNA